jgi:hypothetical protein
MAHLQRLELGQDAFVEILAERYYDARQQWR